MTISRTSGDTTGGNGRPAGGSGESGSGGDPGGGTSATGGTIGEVPTTLRAAAERSGRLIGAALAAPRLSESAYTNAALEFNYVTAENEMKWDATEPARNQFTFTRGDQIASFAMQNGMQLKGHTLVWHSQLPEWVSNLTNAAEVRAAMRNHIQAVVTHYRGQVTAWDVVNEAWNDDGASLRNSVFFRYLGSGFIDEAFQAARDADPDARLYYNDYGTEGTSAKADAVYAMVEGMKKRGVPIDGVGMQMHVGWRNLAPTTTEFASNMQRLAALGLDLLVSEMDVHLCEGGTLNCQRTRFHDIVGACMAQRACKAVTVWGITDRYSWLNNRTDQLRCSGSEPPRGLLFDDDYGKKPAYTGLFDALLGQ